MADGTPILRVTIRCLVEDLYFGSERANIDVSELDHEVVRAFVEKRSQSPIGIEKVQPLATAAEVYTLHAGRWRGATWHDADNEAVWLLGCGVHRSGERKDVYPYLKDLDAKGLLFPEADDYELLFELQDLTFTKALIEEIPAILEEARVKRGEEVQAVVAGRIQISVLSEATDGLEALWVAVSMRVFSGGAELPVDWIAALLAAFYPRAHDPFDDLHVSENLPTRTKRTDEIIFVEYRI